MFFWKMVVPHLLNVYFFENSCSAPAERMFFGKMVIPHLLNTCFFKEKFVVVVEI